MQRDVDVDLPGGIIRACLLLVGLVALFVLLWGWGVGSAHVRGVVSGWAEMVPLTALSFLVAAIGIALFSQGSKAEAGISRSTRRAVLILGSALIVIGGIDLADFIAGWGLTWDWLGLDPVKVTGEASFLNPMAQTTAGGFLAIGIALVASVLAGPRLVTNMANLIVMLIGAFGMSGYLFGGSPMLPYSPMAVHTSLCFVFLAIALSGAQSNSWLVRLLESTDVSGMVIQRMFFLAVAGPILTGGLLMSGRLMGWYSAETAMGLFCILLVFIGCSLVAITEGQLRSNRAAFREQKFLVDETGRIGKIGGWETDTINKVGRWTTEVALIHGMPPETPWSRGLVESTIRAEDRHRVKEAYERTCRDQEPYDIQYGLVMPTGESKWVRAQAYPISENGEVIKVRGTLQDITEIKKAELAVRASERRLRAIMDLNPECVKVVSAQGELTEMNKAGLDMLEAPRLEDALVQPLMDYVQPEYREAYGRLHQRVMAGEEGSIEFDLKGLKGNLRSLVTRAVPLRDSNGEVKSLLGITRDITEQKKRAALAEGQKDVLEMIARGLPVKSTMDKLLEVIESCAPDMLCSILLVDQDEKCLRPCSAPRLHPDYVAETDGIKVGEGMGSCGTAAHRQEPVFVEDIDDDPLWKNFKESANCYGLKACWSTPILDANGKPLGTFAVYYREPSKPSAEHLRLIDLASHLVAICLIRHQSVDELKASEWRFRRVVESIDEIFWMRDVHSGKLLYVSPQYEEVWGLPVTDIYENANSWLDHIHPEDRQRMEDAVVDSSAREGYDVTFRIIHPKKGVRWVRSKAYTYRNNSGEIGGRVGVVTDLTDQKHMEEQLFRAQRMEAVGTLAGGIAHDLNNILAPILVACGMLKTSLENESDRKMVETLDKSAQRGAAIIRKLLDFSRGSEGTMSEILPEEMVSEVSDLIRETLPNSVEVSEDVADDLWALRADPSHIHQILMNLCVNARDAMPDGGRLNLRVVNCELSKNDLNRHPDAAIGKYILFVVEDTGAGMTPEVQKRVFDPFFTTKEVGKGSGLGLASVMGIVKNYQGFVTIYSKPGEGTCVRVYLPVSLDLELPVSEPEPPSIAADEPKQLVMIVDDESSICATIGAFLKNHHYRVLTAENGISALAILREHKGEVKLVVTDMVMPEMNGLELLRQLQKEFPTIRTIGTSGLLSRDEILKEGLNDVDAFLEKPYLSDALLAEIRRLLDGV